MTTIPSRSAGDPHAAVVVLTLADLQAQLPPRPSDDRPATMSVDAAARYLGISRSHAYDLVRAGELPHLRLGRRILIPTRDLDALLGRGAGGPASDPGLLA